MSVVLFSPHNDDEALFAAYQVIKHSPMVIVCLLENDVRRKESESACQILGASGFAQWHFPAVRPDWNELRAAVASEVAHYELALAPAPNFLANGHTPENPERGFGVMQHDMIGHLVLEAFGPSRTILYETYTRAGRAWGQEVAILEGWIQKKLQALACYRSQHDLPFIREWFVDATLREYLR